MSGNRFNFGESILDAVERLIITGHATKEDFVKALSSYLTSMQERCPDVHHPDMDWMTKGFSMIVLNQDQSVTTPPELSSIDDVKEVVRHELLAVSQPLASMQRRLDEHSSCHTVIELNSSQTEMESYEVYTEEDLRPLYLLQTASTTKVG